MNNDFSRQRGGNYGAKGSGETQLELNRRNVREKINQTKFNITRKDSLNIDFSYQEKILTQNYEYLHSTDFNFLQNYTITSGIGTIFATESSKVNSIGIILDIGGKISF